MRRFDRKLWGIVLVTFLLGFLVSHVVAKSLTEEPQLPEHCAEALHKASAVVSVASNGFMIANDIPEDLAGVMPIWERSVSDFMATYPLCVQ